MKSNPYRTGITLSSLIAKAALAFPAHAQTTSTVSGPKVKENDRSFGYRIAAAPESDRFNQRFHYNHALSDRLQVRAIINQNDSGGDFRFRTVQIETQYQFIKTERGWNSAVQVQGQIPDGNDGPGRVRIAWLNSWDVSENWELRGGLFAAREIGDRARDGFLLETRAQVSRSLGGGYSVSLQSFDSWGSTDSFGSLSAQHHAAGRIFQANLATKLDIQQASSSA